MSKTHFEIIEISNTQLTVDVSLISRDEIWFNATEVAKAFGKNPKDWLRTEENQQYIEALSKEENLPIKKLVIVKRGRYGGTWLHKSLRIPFARWCSPLFAVRLDKWVVQRLTEEHARRQARLAARTGYLPMSEAVILIHDPAKHYHFSNEANLINRIVLGMTAKEFKKQYGVDSVRDALSAAQLESVDKLQRINTSLMEIGVPFQERKVILSDHFNKRIKLAA